MDNKNGHSFLLTHIILLLVVVGDIAETAYCNGCCHPCITHSCTC